MKTWIVAAFAACLTMSAAQAARVNPECITVDGVQYCPNRTVCKVYDNGWNTKGPELIRKDEDVSPGNSGKDGKDGKDGKSAEKPNNGGNKCGGNCGVGKGNGGGNGTGNEGKKK